jgi:serpin B
MDILNPNSAALYNQFNKPNPDYKLARHSQWLMDAARANTY